jgi:hypothetical protein
MSSSTGDDEVLAVIRQRGSAAVMVALIEPAAPADATDPAATRAAVQRLQDDVLRSVEASDFTLRVRFESVAAFAGTIHSERGFRRLVEHPSVRRVSLEIGGGGQ